jgi:hypothetical protein
MYRCIYVLKVVEYPPLRENQSEMWSYSPLTIPHYVPPRVEPQVPVEEKKVLTSKGGKKPSANEKLAATAVDMRSEINPVEVAPKQPLVLKEEEAIYLYPSPKIAPSLNNFVLIELPNSVKPLVEKVEAPSKKREVKSRYYKSTTITTESQAEVIPFSRETEEALPSSRWVVPARSEMVLVVAFRADAPCFHDIALHFETVESKV